MMNDESGGGESGASSSTAESIQERTFRFACRVVRASQSLDDSAAGRHTAGQLLLAGTSIGAHLEEAHGAQSRRDFVAKVSLALKEARETLYWLRVVDACKLVSPRRLETLIGETGELVAILTAIRKKAQASLEPDSERRR